MEVFEIKYSSWINYFVTFLTLMSLVGIIGNQIFTISLATSIVLTIPSLFLLYHVSQFTATALTIWTITPNSIHVKWTKPVLFHRLKPEVLIMWEEIQAYKISGDKLFDSFKLVLKDGTVLKYWHDNLITKDDFNKFIDYFIERVQEHNEKEIEKEIADKIGSN